MGDELVKRLREIAVERDAAAWYSGSARAQDHSISGMLAGEAADRIAALERENAALREALGAACGYLLNAKIDLETGARKSTAIATIEGGLRRVRGALQERTDADQAGA